jgi:hypothetical protein
MTCLQCDCELPGVTREALFPSYWRGCLLLVPAPAEECSRCGYVSLPNGSIDEFCQNTRNTYEKNMRFLSLCLTRHPELATFL